MFFYKDVCLAKTRCLLKFLLTTCQCHLKLSVPALSVKSQDKLGRTPFSELLHLLRLSRGARSRGTDSTHVNVRLLANDALSVNMMVCTFEN